MKHFPGLTGIRGWAAVAVVIYHAAFEYGPYYGERPFPGTGFLWLGVDVFFILSGYLLAASYLERAPNYGAYLWARFLRLAPPYYASIPLTMLLMSGIPDRPGIVLFAHATFSHNVVPETLTAINVLYWTLAVEWQFYLLLPLVIAAFKSPRGALIAAAVTTVLFRFFGWEFWPWGSMFFLPAYLLPFCLGVYMAHDRRWQNWDSRKSVGVALFAFLAAMMWLTLAQPPDNFEQANHSQWSHTIVRPVMGVILAFLVAASANLTLAKMAWSQWVGRISFSLYLTHVPIVLLFRKLPVFQYGFLPYAAIVLSASLIVGWLFYLLVERPSLRLRGNWTHSNQTTKELK